MTPNTPTAPLVLNERYELVPLDLLREHPDNPRRGDVEVIANSIDVNGFYGAVVVQQSTGFILAGNHRFKAARSLALQAIPVIWLDVDDDRARRILIGDNRTSDLALYDDDVLATMLRQLQDTPAGLDGTGYSDEDLTALLDELSDAPMDEEDNNREMLARTDVQEPNPKREPAVGDVWRVGSHVLYVVDPIAGWTHYVPELRDAVRDRLCWFPDMLLPLCVGDDVRLVLVQPDTWSAGHLLDRYAEQHGDAFVQKVRGA